MPLLLLIALGLPASLTYAAEAISPPPVSGAVHELSGPSDHGLDARNWHLDSAVFTEITPFTAPDIAITLPAEQLDEEPAADPEAGPIVVVPTPEAAPQQQ